MNLSKILGILSSKRCFPICLSFLLSFFAFALRPDCEIPLKGSPELSSFEKSQLGTFRVDSAGHPTLYSYPSRSEWKRLRKMLVENSLKSNPLLDPTLSAYTPGETRALLENSQVKNWHQRFRQFIVPPEFSIIALVPCAKTKPWSNATKGLYASYNKLRKMVREGSLPPIYFVTLSEPLGVVPEYFWSNFPQYDNPGLFTSNAMRSSMFKQDWEKTEFGKVLELPFDPEAKKEVIKQLASVISDFMRTNSDKLILSFVEDLSEKSTHSEMLDQVNQMEPGLLLPERRYLKRGRPRTPPFEYMKKILKHIKGSSLYRAQK